MSVHITVGCLTWCAVNNRQQTEAMAAGLGIKGCCQHARLTDGLKFRHYLEQMLVENVSVRQGPCPWNPSNPELSRLLHE